MRASTAHFLRLLLVVTAALLLAFPTVGGPLKDEQISLRPEGLLQLTHPVQPEYSAKDPGENKLLTRAYYGAPPMIPHSIADQSLSATSNDCMDCHEAGDKDTPGLPATHRIKALFGEYTRGQARNGALTAFSGFGRVDTVSGNRYDCMLCHAPQASNAEPLVENTFQPVFPAGSPKDKTDGLRSTGAY